MFIIAFARRQAISEGRKDGLRTIPGWDSPDFAPYVGYLAHSMQARVESFVAGFDKEDNPLKTRFTKTRDSRDRWQAKTTEAQAAYDKALDNYEQEHGFRPAVVKPASGFVYGLLMFMLFIGESPLNFAVFNVLALPIPLQLLLALVVGVAFVMSAHHLGRLLSDGPFRTWQSTASFIACLIVPVLVMSGMAYMREQYASGVLAAMNETNKGLPGVPKFDLSSSVVMWTFLGLNLLLYVIGVAYSHHIHDPLSLTASTLNRAKRLLATAEGQLRTAVAKRVKLAYRYGAAFHREKANLKALVNAYYKMLV